MIQRLLEREAEAWRNLSPAEYDDALCMMLEEIDGFSSAAERIDALVTLASKTLRRNEPTLIKSRFQYAKSLLALANEVSDPVLLWRIRFLFLLAWQWLGTVVERGPESISTTPDLPPGAALPYGADPDAIKDPALREQAYEAAGRHGEAVDRWNAKQRALGYLHRLASFVESDSDILKDREETTLELLMAMSLTPGVPDAIRRTLIDAAG